MYKCSKASGIGTCWQRYRVWIYRYMFLYVCVDRNGCNRYMLMMQFWVYYTGMDCDSLAKYIVVLILTCHLHTHSLIHLLWKKISYSVPQCLLVMYLSGCQLCDSVDVSYVPQWMSVMYLSGCQLCTSVDVSYVTQWLSVMWLSGCQLCASVAVSYVPQWLSVMCLSGCQLCDSVAVAYGTQWLSVMCLSGCRLCASEAVGYMPHWLSVMWLSDWWSTPNTQFTSISCLDGRLNFPICSSCFLFIVIELPCIL